MPLAPQRWQALNPPAANVGLLVTVNGYDRNSVLADRSLNVHVGTHGNSLGTADATFNDPAVPPVADDVLRVFVNTLELFEGRIKDVTVSEWKQGSHFFVKVGAQDLGPDSTLPVTPPWNLSDNPNGTTTHGYTTAQKVTRTTEGGSPRTTITTGIREHGLWAGMQVQITSAILGLAAAAYDIKDATLRFPTRNAPEYSFELGEPLVDLAQLISSGTMLDPGSIRSTQISDGAISTPKLAANAVIAGVVSIGTPPSQVVIIGGSITVTNPSGTVIIDGTSNMFKIAASGTLSLATTAIQIGATTTTTLSGLGALATTPAHQDYISSTNTASSVRSQGFVISAAVGYVAASSGGSPTNPAITPTQYARVATYLDGSNFCVVEFLIGNANLGTNTWYATYYVLKETAV